MDAFRNSFDKNHPPCAEKRFVVADSQEQYDYLRTTYPKYWDDGVVEIQAEDGVTVDGAKYTRACLVDGKLAFEAIPCP